MIKSFPVNAERNFGSIEFEPCPGDHIAQCFEKASQIACKLGLNWAWFKHNDLECTAYPNGQGLEILDGGGIAYWKRLNSTQWQRDDRKQG